ncbi:MAG: sugar ABC transporter permease [Protaetiibacter sp.]
MTTIGSAPRPASGPAAGPARRWLTLGRRRTITGLLLTAPSAVLVTVLFVAPLVLMVVMSLHNWPLLGSGRRFRGLDNYLEAFADPVFGQSILFTLKYTLIVTPLTLVLGYLLAILVRRRVRGVGFFRAVYFAPVVVGFAAGAFIFLSMSQVDVGALDWLFRALGWSSGSPLMVQPGPALAVVVLMVVWKTVGTTMIILMAGMQGIPAEVYESAQVDGAGAWHREFSMTLPLLRPYLALTLLLTVTGSFLAFDQFYILTQGGPQQQTTTVVMWLFTQGFVRYRLGYAAALSVLLLLLLLVFTVFQVRALRAEDER